MNTGDFNRWLFHGRRPDPSDWKREHNQSLVGHRHRARLIGCGKAVTRQLTHIKEMPGHLKFSIDVYISDYLSFAGAFLRFETA
jgi:hypothetical protein